MNKVSIAIPAYNQPDHLRECLQSIANQTLINQIEVFVFDDNGPNSLEGVVSEFPQLSINYRKNNERLGAAGNISQAFSFDYKTPYVLVFHHDDTMHPRMVEEQVKILDKIEDLLWVGTKLRFAFLKDMNIFGFSDNELIKFVEYVDAGGLTLDLLRGISLSFGSVMYRKDALGLARINYERFSAISDRPFLVDIARHGKTAFIKNKLVNYRIHSGQDSKTNADIGIKQGVALMQFYKEQLASPIPWRVRRIFYICATNNLLDSYLRLGEGRPSLRQYIRDMKKNGVMNLWYLNRIGLRAILKTVLK
ncbi:MAG: hypothetical protein COU10_03385 [Candidatus Harrisonbacteria bacterium CG10_big_fil_rev_8_21_14_0_10_45_28]|uniref:Glycosyltransferase 2-like domain-containing protein n=1 Tax=Candidatus Harrisonbacteria bacterium CG10_big_fil_rev_8_21_14_0_10_45_28 TaxID=1974586 RepID=A0A2H0UMP0_9BACT|nr:MAG: hypothetical protein COU10_03385 [Candidatus Harrisonbacteria bacterium CG10_big_fil_rev_8_21_14_0_10_45_28]